MHKQFNIIIMEGIQNVFKDQVKYKGRIIELGLKSSFVAEKIGVRDGNFSMYINGLLSMPNHVRINLDRFLAKYKNL